MHHSKQKLTVELRLLQRRPLLRMLQVDSFDDAPTMMITDVTRRWKWRLFEEGLQDVWRKSEVKLDFGVVAENYECRLFNHLIQGFLLLFFLNEVKYKILLLLLVCIVYHQFIFYVFNYVTFKAQGRSLTIECSFILSFLPLFLWYVVTNGCCRILKFASRLGDIRRIPILSTTSIV